MPEQRNLILAIVISILIILGFQYFYELPRMQQAQLEAERRAAQEQVFEEAITPLPRVVGDDGVSLDASMEPSPVAIRVPIEGTRVKGSLSLAGGRLDELRLLDYRETLEPDSALVEVLSPIGTEFPYFAEFGWVPDNPSIVVPDSQTVWSADANALTTSRPVTLTWDNGEDLRFERRIAIDDNFLFTITQSVTNRGNEPVTLHPYGLISRWGEVPILGFWILHEGPIGVFNSTLEEFSYKNLRERGEIPFEAQGGWLGMTDKYWLTALIPDQNDELEANFRFVDFGPGGRYQTDFLRSPVVIPPGQTVSVTDHLFAGAKEVLLLERYGRLLGLELFDRAVDFGWFWFLTKPFFYILHWLFVFFGNYGVAILILTLMVKLLFYPLANKSYVAMSQMKKLQPEMLKIRERYENDREKMNQEMMALYKREKVNPASGCLPILVQIPVFFALYKVLFVSIEMRHAPFFGWIQDLSAPDPTTIFNLFGILPFDMPLWIPAIGVWPIVMGATMWLQMRLNPTPPDPIQAKVMAFLPWIFVFLFATFPAGLVIYWAWNNVLSIGQQWLIMRRMNVSIT
ncbi:MAG: membrane protein insertase YidC [Geminicoccaceae bacterium]|nr:MAG: membrane protein insertase YidC [Geminicoccaceae bacterium]